MLYCSLLGINSRNNFLTFTALKTTAALAWASLGVIRSQIDCASLSLGV